MSVASRQPAGAVDVMSLIRFCVDPNGSRSSILGRISVRQVRVLAAYGYTPNLLASDMTKRLLRLCGGGTAGARELMWMRRHVRPLVFFVEVHERGTFNLVDEEYASGSKFANVEDVWNPQGEPLPRKYIDAYMQSVERCEFNTHFLMLVLNAQKSTLHIRSKVNGLGVVTDVGYVRCRASVKSNPMLIPYSQDAERNMMAQTLYTDDNDTFKPGDLVGGCFLHLMLRLNVAFGDTEQVYHIDSTASQIDPLREDRVCVVRGELHEGFTHVEAHAFDTDESLDMILAQCLKLDETFEYSIAEQAVQRCEDALSSVDGRHGTQLLAAFRSRLGRYSCLRM